MTGYSRRQLAKYAADELAGGKPDKHLAQKLASAMVASGRGKQGDLLISDIYRELEERGVSARAVVSTARPLSDSLAHEISKKIKQLAGVGDVSLERVVNEDLLGGLKIQTANREWDDTIRKRLQAIKEMA